MIDGAAPIVGSNPARLSSRANDIRKDSLPPKVLEIRRGAVRDRAQTEPDDVKMVIFAITTVTENTKAVTTGDPNNAG